MSEAPLLPCPRGCAEPPVRGPHEDDEYGPWVICARDDCSYSARESDWQSRAPRASEGEARFLEAAREYARLMTRDTRNTHDHAKVRGELDRARDEFYATYRALETP